MKWLHHVVGKCKQILLSRRKSGLSDWRLLLRMRKMWENGWVFRIKLASSISNQIQGQSHWSRKSLASTTAINRRGILLWLNRASMLLRSILNQVRTLMLERSPPRRKSRDRPSFIVLIVNKLESLRWI